MNDFATKKPLALASQKNILAQKHIEKTLTNAEAIQAMGMLPSVIKKWFVENETTLSLQSIISDRSNLIISFSKLIRLLLQVCIPGIGAYLVILNQITPGIMIACSIIAARALAPIEQTISMWKQWKDTQRAYDRLTKYLLKPSSRIKGIKLPKSKGSLAVNNLTYTPPGNKKPIIKDVSFQLSPGELLVLT